MTKRRHFMRTPALVLGAILATGPVLAQTAVEQAHGMITAQNAAAGFPPALADTLAVCFTAQMSEDEAEVILASEPGPAQQVAARMMQHYDDAVACTASVAR